MMAPSRRGTPIILYLRYPARAVLCEFEVHLRPAAPLLLDAVIASANALLAGRFDTALNNMPHGLCMFDARRAAGGSNQRLANCSASNSPRAQGRDCPGSCATA